jgi:twitching motility two-component system response regulator PilH
MKKILVADDNPYILEVVSMTMETLNYRVSHARDGLEVLEQVRKDPPDLIILDIMMPKKNGFEVCRELKQSPEFRHIPVVMLTAKAQKEDRYWGRDAGADDYITKPFDPLELERVVTRLLELKDAGGGYHPLTRLPTHASIEKEIERRRAGQEEFRVSEFRFSLEAQEVFCQKYGGVKWEEVLAVTADILREQSERLGGETCFLGHRGESTFVLIGPPQAVETIGKAATEEVGKAIALFYDEEDLRRGHVRRGGEIFPLLALTRTLLPPP